MTNKRIIFLVSVVLVAMQLIAAPELSTAEIQSTAPSDVRDIDMLSSTDGWMVGAQGQIWRYNGTTWVTQVSPTTENLNAVQALAVDEAWIVGNSGVILYWNGSTWNVVSSGTTANLEEISFSGPSDGWIVGDLQGPISQPLVILHWAGTQWSSFDVTEFGFPQPHLADVAAFGPESVRFMAYFGGTYYWDGNHVIKNWGGSGSLTAMDFLNENVGWTVSYYGDSSRWNGNNWEIVPTPYKEISGGSSERPRLLMDVKTVSETEAWAVGTQGAIMKWDGLKWEVFNSPTPADLLTIDVPASGELYIGANEGWMHYDGSQWQNHIAEILYDGTVEITTMDSVSHGDVWAVGEGRIFHLVNGVWVEQFNSTLERYLGEIDMVSEFDGWLTGSGEIYRYSPNGWMPYNLPQYHSISQIIMLDENIGFGLGSAIGGPPFYEPEQAFYRWNGSEWTSEVVGQFKMVQRTNKFSAPAADFVIVGNGNGYWWWDGAIWQANEDGPIGGFDLSSKTDGWSLSELTFSRWDGVKWNAFKNTVDCVSGNQQDAFVDLVDSEAGWAALNCRGNTYIYHWNNIDWSLVEIVDEHSATELTAVNEAIAWVALNNQDDSYSLKLLFMPTDIAYIPAVFR